MTALQRQELLEVLTQVRTAARSILANTPPIKRMLTKLGQTQAVQFFDLLEFTSLLQFDLATLFGDFIRDEFEGHAHVYSRFVILTIYEAAKTYRSLLGEDFQNALSTNGPGETLIPKVRAIHKRLNAIAGIAERTYGDVRRGSAAHRDARAHDQLVRLQGIGGEELAGFSISFLEALQELEIILSEFVGGLTDGIKSHLNVVILGVGARGNVVVTFSGGDPADARPSPERFEWLSSDEAVARVSASGIIQAVAPGNALVEFSLKGSSKVAGSVLVLVGDPGELQDLVKDYEVYMQSLWAK